MSTTTLDAKLAELENMVGEKPRFIVVVDWKRDGARTIHYLFGKDYAEDIATPTSQVHRTLLIDCETRQVMENVNEH